MVERGCDSLLVCRSDVSSDYKRKPTDCFLVSIGRRYQIVLKAVGYRPVSGWVIE